MIDNDFTDGFDPNLLPFLNPDDPHPSGIGTNLDWFDWRQERDRTRCYYLPSPAEIVERAAEIRAEWSAYDFHARRFKATHLDGVGMHDAYNSSWLPPTAKFAS